MSPILRCLRVATPLGTVVLTARADALVAAHFEDQRIAPPASRGAVDVRGDRLLQRAADALARYFDDGDCASDVPVAAQGTSFQRAVWDAIGRVPMGTTATYLGIARSIGAPSAARAVGAATGRNPLCIFIACHRIVGSNASLTGYAGGLARKRALLALEACALARRQARAA